MDKLLNTFSTESNGEIVTVVVRETEKGLVVDITGNTMDVRINHEELYSKFDKDEYKYIPSHLRSFIEEHLCHYGEGLVKREGQVVCNLTLTGLDYYCLVSTKRAKDNTLRLRDWLIDYQQLTDNGIMVDIAVEKQKFSELQDTIKSRGYELQISHEGNDYDYWTDLVIPLNDFDLKRVETCLKVWQDYNRYLIDTYLDGKY